MLTPHVLLLLDGVINLALGLLLLFFPATWVDWLGLPPAGPAFYPGVLGGVLVGIGLALLVERSGRARGLGLVGAMLINLCGGFALAGWLLLGGLQLGARGTLFLWALVVLLVGISGVELCSLRRGRGREPGP